MDYRRYEVRPDTGGRHAVWEVKVHDDGRTRDLFIESFTDKYHANKLKETLEGQED